MVTNPSMENNGRTVTVTWDQPEADGGSNSWALIRYRPVGADPDFYKYTYVPGAPDPETIGLHFHEVRRNCKQHGAVWKLTTETTGTNLKGIQTRTNPRRVEFDVDNEGQLWEVGIAAINANGVSDWHTFDHFWNGPTQ